MVHGQHAVTQVRIAAKNAKQYLQKCSNLGPVREVLNKSIEIVVVNCGYDACGTKQ